MSAIPHDRTLVVTSLLSIVLVLLHVSEDIVRGFEPGGLKHVQTILTMGLWLYGTLALSGRWAGYIVMLLGSLLGSLVSVAHMRGAGLAGGRLAGADGVPFFVFTLLALGVTSVVSVVLSARGLWAMRRAGAKGP